MVLYQKFNESLFDHFQRVQIHYLYLPCKSPHLQSPQGHPSLIANMAQVERVPVRGVPEEAQERMIGVSILLEMVGLKRVRKPYKIV